MHPVRVRLLASFIVFISPLGVSCDAGEKAAVAKHLTDLINNLLPHDYNKNIRPKYGIEPLTINVSLHINDISSVSETSMQFNVDFFIRHFWIDPRLSFPVKYNISRVTLGEDFARKIWLPDTYFQNGKESSIHKTVSSEETTLFRVNSNGEVIYSTRIALVARCMMDLSYFPVDQQKCSIEMSSYAQTTDDVLLFWKNDSTAVEFNSQINLPQFSLVGYNKFYRLDVLSTGSYSQIQVDLFLVRSIGFYVSQVYIPACLVVIISWLPFWLDRNDHHARVALGVTTVLTITTLITNTNSDFPKISHVKAIDIYLFVCFIIIFLSLIEYSTVGYFDISYGKVQQEGDHSSQVANSNATQKTILKDTSLIDYLARRLFPLFFLIFNVTYAAVLYFLISINSSHTEIQVKL